MAKTISGVQIPEKSITWPASFRKIQFCGDVATVLYYFGVSRQGGFPVQAWQVTRQGRREQTLYIAKTIREHNKREFFNGSDRSIVTISLIRRQRWWHFSSGMDSERRRSLTPQLSEKIIIILRPFCYCMILVVYLGHGNFHTVPSCLVFLQISFWGKVFKLSN